MPFAPTPDTSVWPSLSPAERYTRTLVSLTREVWGARCTFETAIGAICEGAAWALDVERVSVWHYSRESGALNCLNSWDAVKRIHSVTDGQEVLAINADAYMATLQDVRFQSSQRPDCGAPREFHRGVFPDFIRRFRMNAVLDAPACAGGELLGAICHESCQAERVWTSEEATFAASMGDFVTMAYEIDRRHSAEAEVEHMLLHDVKTGLANRDYLLELIRQRLLMPHDAEQVVAIILVLVDSSSVASAAHAPSAEDVMVRIAEELRRLCSSEVDLARVHSNKFAFLLSRDAVQGKAVHLAERCLERLHSLDWENAETAPGMAVGIAFADQSTNNEPSALLRQAEEAAQRAQDANNHGYEVFEPAHHDKLVERLRLERLLRNALAQDEFEIYYQPEYDAVRRQWVAAEALLRWNHGGVVRAAGEFIEVAEASGLMIPLGKFVLRQACRDAAQWPLTCDGILLELRINVSARQFASESLAEDIASALEDSGLSPDRLCLEITETTLMGNIDAALCTMNTLRVTGIHLAIDDFGTGFASLVYLKKLPIDILKIDQTFVFGLPNNPVDAAIVSAIAGLANVLNIDVIAEGVETIEQQHALTAIGVRRMQGWLYAKAMKQDDLFALIATPIGSPEPNPP